MIAPVTKTKWFSWRAGQLCKGCSLCVQGRKLVLFITGLCSKRCFYCPIGELKSGKDVVFANEWKVSNTANPQEMLREAKLTEARGAGITGGDPLMRLDRCCEYITLLKKEFGKDFHIHLYAPLELVTEDALKRLHDAGLDEIRFHPDLDNQLLWERIKLANQFKWDVGIEIPAIPGYEEKTKKLIDFAAPLIDFINLNELELSDTQTSHYKLDTMGFEPKNEISYGVKGSEEMALRMLKYAGRKGLRAHYCTAKLKDAVQVKERLKIRAKNIALPFDKLTGEGTLLRGCVYLEELAPGADYQKRIENAKDIQEKLIKAKDNLAKLGLKKVAVDISKPRILVPRTDLKHYSAKIKRLGLIPALVEEYPTSDALEIEVDFL